ncbi:MULTISPECIES: sigma-70 family RNA polymerase sigma factor [unclassified Pseudoclavibacter]|uniref:sigma-70 family RNA polymerase sigma factor n=1 Tax=unclassified Pseudoclavibacter TaxID=2615177 RepID=UPI001BAE53C4|nr:sigma-70 family RNA polymerase sigma factor [Pseudoclavibacter sp. Marseille-Q4354]MBS3177202.1 sigma-70 family RNA polymerase sigma factor [Pseudoclavibacter sp. Marseille-Q4354]
MTLAPDRPTVAAPSVETLHRAVEECRGRVGARVPDHLVDDVLSLTLIEAWKKVATFDSTRGQVEAWVWGICHNMIRKALRDAGRVGRIAEAAETNRMHSQRSSSDPQHLLTERYDHVDWMQRVAEFVGDEDWDVMLDLALTDEHPKDVADRHGLSLRKVQVVRQRCEAIGRVVRAAQEAPLPNLHAEFRDAAVACVPLDVFDADRVLPLLNRHDLKASSADELAAELGVSVSTARRLLKGVRELIDIAFTVLDQRSLTREFS